MAESNIPKKTTLLWQIRIGAVSLILFILLCFISFLQPYIYLLGTIFICLIAFIIFWYIPRFFKSYELIFPNGSVVINRGVFIKTSHIMPFSRLIYAGSFSTPLANRMGLAALNLKAARSSLIIPEITREDVKLFIDYLTEESNN